MATGDLAAFAELYDQFVDRVYRYVYLRTGSHSEAEALTEEVFLKLWEGLRHSGCQEPFLLSLYGLSHTLSIENARREQRAAFLSGDQPADALPIRTGRFAGRPGADRQARALGLLTPDYQQILVLKFIEGLRDDQIGRIMGESEQAVRVLQVRALLSLSLFGGISVSAHEFR